MIVFRLSDFSRDVRSLSVKARREHTPPSSCRGAVVQGFDMLFCYPVILLFSYFLSLVLFFLTLLLFGAARAVIMLHSPTDTEILKF